MKAFGYNRYVTLDLMASTGTAGTSECGSNKGWTLYYLYALYSWQLGAIPNQQPGGGTQGALYSGEWHNSSEAWVKHCIRIRIRL